jgi:hypothetical protein
MCDEISTSAATDLQCGFIWMKQLGADRDQRSQSKKPFINYSLIVIEQK